jgi:hypothetical protein
LLVRYIARVVFHSRGALASHPVAPAAGAQTKRRPRDAPKIPPNNISAVLPINYNDSQIKRIALSLCD